MSSVDPADLPVLLELAVTTAEAAADLLLEGLGRSRVEVSTKSSSTDMVTEMDRRSEALIVECLLADRSDDGILGEEGARHDGTSGTVWVIDPLDGTTNYLYGYPGFGVSIAAVREGVPVIGVVVDPFHRETFTATARGGSHRNGERLHGPRACDLADALLSTGFSYDAAQRARQGNVIAAVLPRVRDLRRGGAAAVDLCWAGCGRVDGFYERGLAPWDLAAGWLVAREAGAQVGNLSGGEPGPEGTLAAHPALFPRLVELLVAAGADLA